MAVSWPPPGIDAAQDHLHPCGCCAARERALAVGDPADLLDAGDGRERRCLSGGERSGLAAHRIGDHRGVAPHELALQVLAVAGHQRHGDDHGRDPQGRGEQGRPRRAVEQAAALARAGSARRSPRGGGRRGRDRERVATAGTAYEPLPGDAVEEAVEEARGVVRARRGLGVVLHGLHRLARRPRSPRPCRRSGSAGSPRSAAGSEAGSTAKPWFWLVIATLPVPQVAHRLVAAVVAELELEGASRPGRGRGAGGPGRCRRPAVARRRSSRTLLDDPRQRLRIARAVREHDAVDRQGQAPRRPACGRAARSAAPRARRASAGCWP